MTSKQKAIREGKKRWAAYKAEKKKCLTGEERKAFFIAYSSGLKRWREMLCTLSAEEQKYQKQVYGAFIRRRYALPGAVAVLAAAVVFLGVKLLF